MSELGKLLIVFGAVMILVGLVLVWRVHIPWIGRLPGDISVERGNFRFYFPLATSLVLSLVISVLLYWLRK